MDEYQLIQKLVNLVGEFRKNHTEEQFSIASFLAWTQGELEETASNTDLKITRFSLETELAAYIGRLGRYSNTYIKTALEGLPFSTDMEFAFTAILDGAGQVGKTDLIRLMAYDRSSGMGVIRRLLKKGIIEEFPNPQDKRGKLLRLTDLGRQSVQMAYRHAPKAAHLVSKNLSYKEKLQLLLLLKKLDDFHYPLYLAEKKGKELFE